MQAKTGKRYTRIVGMILAAICFACFCGCGSKDGGVSDGMEPWEGGKREDAAYAETYVPDDCALINPPTAVHAVTSQATLDALKRGTWRPSNVIVRFSKNYNVVDEAGNKLDSFAHLYDTLLKGKMIPVLYLTDEACADAAITFMTERLEIADMAVMSESAAAVKKVRLAFPEVRGILAYSNVSSVHGLAAAANEALAATVALPQSAASAENVRYIQARLKTVWVRAESDTRAAYLDCIGSGAYGVVMSDFNRYYNLLSEYAKGYIRSPFNIGHRGVNTHHDNSASGARAASAEGATHVELDGWLTKDGHIVMMHNEDINATTNGQGKVTQMTLEEIRQYKLIQRGEPEEIPTLEDIIDALKAGGNEAVLVFEVKDGNEVILEKLKTILTEKQFEERVVVISFALNIIQAMKTVLPRVPTAQLRNTMGVDDIASCALQNTGIDIEKANMTADFENFAKDRGQLGWYWTFASAGVAGAAAKDGFVGITSDDAVKFAAGSTLFVKPLASYAPTETLEEGAKIALRRISYTGAVTETEGKVRFVEDLGDKFAVVASVEGEEKPSFAPRMFTQVFYVAKA